jgi:hypothetical protein
MTLPPHSQTVMNVQRKLLDKEKLIYRPNERNISKLILIPHALLNVSNSQTQILNIDANENSYTIQNNTRNPTPAVSTIDSYTIRNNKKHQQQLPDHTNQTKRALS